MLKFVVLTAVFSLVYSAGIKLHLTDEMKAMLRKSKWDHKNTVISIHGPMTLNLQSSYKLRNGQVFLKSHIKEKHKDCADILKHRPLSKDGVYTIYPDMKTKKSVFCDMTTDGGGWTVIQRRQDGVTDFYRNWAEYKNGFGDAENEYWLGNDAIHTLTKDKKQELRIDLERFSRQKAHATYSTFYIGNGAEKYKLTLGGFKGTKGLGDSLSVTKNMKFSTKDRDNDTDSKSCAQTYITAGWFSNCFNTNLNDEVKAMLKKTKWDHKNTVISIQGPMTLDIQSSYKLKEGRVFLKSHVKEKHKDCADILKHRPMSKDGVYTIYPDMNTNKSVFCDMTTDGGGWPVIQRRQDGVTDFYRNWAEYKNGFGDAEDEYWLGNDAIHTLTKDKKQELRIDLERFSRQKAHATYSIFYIGNEADQYKLTVGGFKGTKGLGDSFGYENGMKFSTKDKDNDTHSKVSCAQYYTTAGWLFNCLSSNLNGVYRKDSKKDGKELSWYDNGQLHRSV
ncbi:fibrinogen alpha chain-like [Saccostrea echinata]|uniref:fibrinogen alpha chain-like n=1 Tax=Saccostrea echinata TaxID=191078 RepID=UPI002A80A2BB|nr:fibrinogen alpha chain-like [Saccostrea echinata]